MIKTVGLSKNYKEVEALVDLNLTIDKGSVFGFIGPNGAGKTTAMSILATLLSPTRGKAYVGGFEVTEQPEEVRQIIGYMPDFFGVYDNLKVDEYLDFYAQAYFVPASKRPGLIIDLLELVNLSGKEGVYVDTLSRGMKQRLGLARCLVHSPQVLILDEPASGLDPRARVEMREILKELGKLGKTILISSHILHELTDMCDTIGIIENGRMVTSGQVKDILSQAKGMGTIRINLLGQHQETFDYLKRHQLVNDVIRDDHGLRVYITGGQQESYRLLKELVTNGFPVTGFYPEQEDLENVFMKITQEVAQ
ncbi:ABC transporter ATP-binding protein [Desulfitibacter alkalitolerans]|uniref:ABC transporter ATP-binding protein n=1 Tax=Desulfitibacter alkalitolerans TaxID=264641 RepID=UPI000488AE4E|nr:ABC transporter ATP-binding protein [Desulfitibacter alkalitolerans]